MHNIYTIWKYDSATATASDGNGTIICSGIEGWATKNCNTPVQPY